MRDDAAYWRDRALQAEEHLAEAQRRDFERWQATGGAPSSFTLALRGHGTRISRVDTRVGDVDASMIVRPSGHLYASDQSVGQAWATAAEIVTCTIRDHAIPGVTGFISATLPAGVLAIHCRSLDTAIRVGDMQQMTSADRRHARGLLKPPSSRRPVSLLSWVAAGVTAAIGIAQKLSAAGPLALNTSGVAALSIATVVATAAVPVTGDEPSLAAPSPATTSRHPSTDGSRSKASKPDTPSPAPSRHRSRRPRPTPAGSPFVQAEPVDMPPPASAGPASSTPATAKPALPETPQPTTSVLTQPQSTASHTEPSRHANKGPKGPKGHGHHGNPAPGRHELGEHVRQVRAGHGP